MLLLLLRKKMIGKKLRLNLDPGHQFLVNLYPGHQLCKSRSNLCKSRFLYRVAHYNLVTIVFFFTTLCVQYLLCDIFDHLLG